MKVILVIFMAASMTLSSARPTFDKIAEAVLNAIDGDPYPYSSHGYATHPNKYQEVHHHHHHPHHQNGAGGYYQQPGYTNYYPGQGPYAQGPYVQGNYAERPYVQGPYIQEPPYPYPQSSYPSRYPAAQGYQGTPQGGAYGVTVSAGYQAPTYPQQGYKTHGY